MKKVFYIAGPLNSGAKSQLDRQANILASERVARAVMLAGGAAINVLRANDHMEDVSSDFEFWMSCDLAILAKCDAIVMCRGWDRSDGAMREHEHARSNGIPIFYCVDAKVGRELKQFIDLNPDIS
jgi:hypothetical protein